MEKSVKTEEDFDFSMFDQSVDTMPEEGPRKEPKPAWFPSAKGRSIVWEHITWTVENQKAACRYCNAEFQVKGGTSALLRHLKAIHPAAINFDPDNAPPVARRKKKKIEDYTIVTEDTKSYMDNLLEQFLHEEPTPSDQHHHLQVQHRADTEIDEVIRNLQQENGEQQPDQDLRKLLGIGDGSPIREEVVAIGNDEQGTTTPIPDEEKEVSSSSGACKKRKADEEKSTEFRTGHFHEMAKHGKYNINLASALRRPPPPGNPAMLTSSHPMPPPPQTTSFHKYNAHDVSVLDFEAKVLYNQSMHSTIARENAMTSYYRLKARKLELEIKQMERDMGEEDVQEEV